ncbi:MAG: hypothetical protein PHI66_01785, partial [Candidatus Pacebacteria bacterium]|nr:hypothetical protein [Candidatus Paceibacterota bacterium]
MADEKLEEILSERDSFEFGSEEWDKLDREKAGYLESIKSSMKDNTIYFEEVDLDGIEKVFSGNTEIFDLPFGVEKRSLLEYHPTRRHPIPYILVRFEDKYFFTLREQGGSELRLIGKKGLIGGHVDDCDVVEDSLEKTCYNALFREAAEEAGVNEDIIKSVSLRGLIRSDLGVDFDHLGLIYEIELLTDE